MTDAAQLRDLEAAYLAAQDAVRANPEDQATVDAYRAAKRAFAEARTAAKTPTEG